MSFHEVSVQYFEWGWLVACILSFPFGYFLARKGVPFFVAMIVLLLVGSVMIYGKYYCK